jgi:hypothetical protein
MNSDYSAIELIFNDLINDITGSWFMDSFTEIKDEYLKGYKEAV